MPEHSDTVIAREEIARYYADRVAEAQAAVAKAQAELDECQRRQTSWATRAEITAERTDKLALTIEVAPLVSHSTSRFQKAAWASIQNPGHAGLRAEADEAGQREEALRRWLTAEGYDLGAMALPEPACARSRGRGIRA